MKKSFFYLVALGLIALAGCQKEFSFETGNAPGSGSLQSDVSGDCLPKTVNGIYEVGTPLIPADNTISIDVDVIETGTYNITTDTVNGFYFHATGTFTSVGINTVTLRSNGTPFAEGIFNFVVSYDSTSCDVQVTVLPSGAGGPATFTINSTGTPASCSGATANGDYIIGSPLNGTNTVVLSVDVTTIGTYSISTTSVNGMTFSGSGAFLNLGANALILTGAGTPIAPAGAITIPVTAGSSSCDFQVTTVAGAEFTFDCSNATVNGTYQAGAVLDATNTIDIPVNVTTAGPYNISVSVNGMSFTAVGTFMTGATNITLAGSGTPSAEGTFSVPFLGTSPCTVTVTVIAGTSASDFKWSFVENGVTYEGPTSGAVEASTGGFNAISISGNSTAPNAELVFSLVLSKTSAMSTGTFNTNSMTSPALFTIVNTTTGTTPYSGAFGNGLSLPVVITVYDQTNKIVEGTFVGQAKDAANTTVTLSAGKFKAQIF